LWVQIPLGALKIYTREILWFTDIQLNNPWKMILFFFQSNNKAGAILPGTPDDVEIINIIFCIISVDEILEIAFSPSRTRNLSRKRE
jgi:hypothetical protein